MSEDSRRELVLGCATLAIAAGYYLMAVRIPQSDIADVIGAQGLPKTYAALLAILSIVLIGRATLARRTAAVRDAPAIAVAPPVPEGPPLPRNVGWRTFGMLMNGVVYVALVTRLGYIVSIAGLIASTIYFQGGAMNRRSLAVAVGGALVLWLLFVRLLHIPHPPGIWPSLF
ncbi:MAG TPA: tripartite tricarboxylate transporter TctB family protein [Vicinamibacterales bacterium]|jgi:putative tricarboxylic transport membrane protein|nr:tripartite tricarboxylate transporter TctB family protein [Vicinamibacterales bacterium]